MCADMVGAAGSWHVWRPERLQSPQPEKERGLAFLPDQHRLAGPTFQCHPSSVPCAGLTAEGQAGEAPATVQGTDILLSTQLQWPQVVQHGGQGHGLQYSDINYC